MWSSVGDPDVISGHHYGPKKYIFNIKQKGPWWWLLETSEMRFPQFYGFLGHYLFKQRYLTFIIDHWSFALPKVDSDTWDEVDEWNLKGLASSLRFTCKFKRKAKKFESILKMNCPFKKKYFLE
jgi:hypothetical protein